MMGGGLVVGHLLAEGGRHWLDLVVAGLVSVGIGGVATASLGWRARVRAAARDIDA
jgi:hypothetical protein